MLLLDGLEVSKAASCAIEINLVIGVFVTKLVAHQSGQKGFQNVSYKKLAFASYPTFLING